MIHDPCTFVVPSKVYFCLITLELASIGIKYQGSNNNPFQQSSPTMMLFLTATSCHAIALTAKISFPTVIIFHVSGVTACETLLWILLTEFWKSIIINVLLSLVLAFCFNNHICKLLTKVQGTICCTCILLRKTCKKCRQEGLNGNKMMTDLEGQESIGAQMADLEGQECIGAQMADLEAVPPNTSRAIHPKAFCIAAILKGRFLLQLYVPIYSSFPLS